MIELCFRASLMAAVGAAALPAAGFGAAAVAAVKLPAVAMPADPENRVASDSRTNALTKNHLALTIHVRPKGRLDNGDRSWQVRSSSLCGYLLKVARQDARTALTVRAPPHAHSAFEEKLYQWAVLMIDG
jgi:hypothetical protein